MLRTVPSISKDIPTSDSENDCTVGQERTTNQPNSDIFPNLNRNSTTEKRKISTKSEDVEGINEKSNEFIDEDETRLEDLVFGNEKSILQNIAKNNSKKNKKFGSLKFNQFLENDDPKKAKISDEFQKRKSIWEDENDEEENNMTIQQENKFIKYYGTPNWADLTNKVKCNSRKDKNLKENNNLSDDEDSDLEDDEPETNFFQQTSNFLVDSSKLTSKNTNLPKTRLQIKLCSDANKEDSDKSRLKCVEFHPNARVMLTAGLSQKLTLFQIDGKRNAKIQSIFIDKFPIMAAHFTKYGDEIILGSRHKSFYYYDMNAGKLINVTPPVKALNEFQRHSIASMFEISPDNRFICFIGSQGQIHLFSCKSKEWINTLKINDQCNSVAFSSDSRYLYAFGDDKDIHVFDMTDRGHRSLYKFTDYGSLGGNSIAISNNNQLIATGCKSGVVNIYNVNEISQNENRNPKPLKSFMNLTTPCTSLKFNATDEILAACSSYAENACKLIHVGSLSVFSNFPQNFLNDSSYSTSAHIRIPQCIDFSMNSGYFTIGNHKGNALLYRLKHYGSF